MYKENIVMYSKKIVDFFKNHGLYDERVFHYLKGHTAMFDYDMDHISARDSMGFAPKIDDFTHKLERFSLYMPYPNNPRTMLMNVNIIAKGIVAYKYLNKRFRNDMNLEAIGFLYEELFARESNDPKIIEFKEAINNDINEESAPLYQYALYAQNEMLEQYEDDIDKMNDLSMKLLKRYNKEHK